MFLFKHTDCSVWVLFYSCDVAFYYLQMETEEKDPMSVASAAAAACTNLEKILQELNVLSDCMNQLACMYHC